MWFWRGGRDHTRGDPGGRRAMEEGERGVEADIPSRCETVSGPKFQLGTQTNHMSQRRCWAEVCKDMHELTVGYKAGVDVSTDVWASHQKLVSKHDCVWTCHLLPLLNKSFASQHSNLYGNRCWQAVSAWFNAFSPRTSRQWITLQLAADHRRLSVSVDWCPSVSWPVRDCESLNF